MFLRAHISLSAFGQPQVFEQKPYRPAAGVRGHVSPGRARVRRGRRVVFRNGVRVFTPGEQIHRVARGREQ